MGENRLLWFRHVKRRDVLEDCKSSFTYEYEWKEKMKKTIIEVLRGMGDVSQLNI